MGKLMMEQLGKLREESGLPYCPVDYLEERIKRKGPLNENLIKDLVGECTQKQFNTLISKLKDRGIVHIATTPVRELKIYGYDYMTEFYLKESDYLRQKTQLSQTLISEPKGRLDVADFIRQLNSDSFSLSEFITFMGYSSPGAKKALRGLATKGYIRLLGGSKGRGNHCTCIITELGRMRFNEQSTKKDNC